MGPFTILGEDGKTRENVYTSEWESMPPVDETKQEHYVQRPLDNFLDHFKVLRYIGYGASGVAFLCWYGNVNKKVVLKFSRHMLRDQYDENPDLLIDIEQINLRDVFQQIDLNNSDEHAVEKFRQEAKVAQLLKEGPYACSRFGPGQCYNMWTNQYMRTIATELRQMQAHPGFQCIHHIFDFRPEYPVCIASEAFSGTLEELPLYDTLEKEWTAIARQAMQGLDYMHFMGVSHKDLHAGNILHNGMPGDRIKIVISDFDQMGSSDKAVFSFNRSTLIEILYNLIENPQALTGSQGIVQNKFLQCMLYTDFERHYQTFAELIGASRPPYLPDFQPFVEEPNPKRHKAHDW